MGMGGDGLAGYVYDEDDLALQLTHVQRLLAERLRRGEIVDAGCGGHFYCCRSCECACKSCGGGEYGGETKHGEAGRWFYVCRTAPMKVVRHIMPLPRGARRLVWSHRIPCQGPAIIMQRSNQITSRAGAAGPRPTFGHVNVPCSRTAVPGGRSCAGAGSWNPPVRSYTGVRR
jgi:hypothetical protein